MPSTSHTKALPCRVIKLGGSLFDMADLAQRFSRWLAEQEEACNVLIAGGGAFCDYIRQQDQAHPLGTSAAHWLCIDAMHLSANLLAERLQLEQESQFEKLTAWHALACQEQTIVFDVARFLRREEAELPGRKLPIGWQVTSDSIAARLAEVLRAEELVLLKSIDVGHSTLEQLAADGIVDADFPQAATACRRVRLVNLREWERL